MLLVESSIYQEQNLLEEEFNRQGNYFAVPIKKTQVLLDLINRLHHEYFLEQLDDEEKDLHQKNKSKGEGVKSQLCRNMLKIIEDLLKLKISLNSVRQLFQLLCDTENKMKLYESHILKLNQVLTLHDEEEREEIRETGNSLSNLTDLFENGLNLTKNKVSTIYSQINTVEDDDKILQRILNKKNLSSVRSLSSLNSGQGESKVKQESMKSLSSNSNLKIQIPNSPKGFHEDYHKKIDSDQESGCSNLQVTNIDQSLYDKKTNETFYCPPWKHIQNQKKKSMNSFFQSTFQNKGLNKNQDDSEFAQNLSTQIVPLPSILTNESINDLMKKDKKQDIKKSNLLKESIASVIKPMCQQKMYDERIRMIKLNQKFRQIKGKSKLKEMKSPQIRKSKGKVKNNQEIQKKKQLKVERKVEQKVQKEGMFFKFKKACFGK